MFKWLKKNNCLFLVLWFEWWWPVFPYLYSYHGVVSILLARRETSGSWEISNHLCPDTLSCCPGLVMALHRYKGAESIGRASDWITWHCGTWNACHDPVFRVLVLNTDPAFTRSLWSNLSVVNRMLFFYQGGGGINSFPCFKSQWTNTSWQTQRKNSANVSEEKIAMEGGGIDETSMQS